MDVESRLKKIEKDLASEEFDIYYPATVELCGIKDPLAIHLLIICAIRGNAIAEDALVEFGEEAVQPLIQVLNSGSSAGTAIQILGRIGDSTAAKHIVKHLKDKDDFTRSAAVNALGELGASDTLDLMIEALKDENEYVRKSAGKALGKLCDLKAVPALVDALRDIDEDVCQYAKTALLAYPDSVDTLVPVVKNIRKESDGQDWKAIERLGKLGDPKAIPVLNSTLSHDSGNVTDAAVLAMVKIGKPSVPPLIEALQHKDRTVRWSAAEALSKLNDPRALKPLIRALKDDKKKGDGGAAYYAAEALGNLGDVSAVEPLISALKKFKNWNAAEALGKLGDKRAVEALIEASRIDDEDDEYGYLRQHVAEALGKLGDLSASEPLIELLNIDNTGIQESTAEALGNAGDFRAIPKLLVLLRPGTEYKHCVKDKAIHSLKLIFEKCDISAFRFIRDALKASDKSVRVAAAESLVRLYKNRELSTGQKIQLLIKRGKITSKHQDKMQYGHTDHNDIQYGASYYSDCTTPHTDKSGSGTHIDKGGIGVEFPL